MAVTINGGQKPPNRSTKNPHHTEMNPAKFEVYGRLNLGTYDIAQLEGCTRAAVGQYMRQPHLRTAYDKGRSECLVAIRQKQVAMALAGDTKMLIYAGYHFAKQRENDPSGIVDTYEPGQHSFDGKFRSRLEQLKDTFAGDAEDAEEA